MCGRMPARVYPKSTKGIMLMNTAAKLMTILSAAVMMSSLCSCNGNKPVNPSEGTTTPAEESSMSEITEGTGLPEGVSVCKVYIDRRAGTIDGELLEEREYTYLGELSHDAIIATAASAMEVTFSMNSIEERDGAIYIDWALDSIDSAFCAAPLSEEENLTDKIWTVLDSVYLTIKQNLGKEVYYSFDGDSLIEASDKLGFADAILSDQPFSGSQYYAAYCDKTVLFEDINWIAAEMDNENGYIFDKDKIAAVEFIDLDFDGRAELVLTSATAENGLSAMSVYGISGGKAAMLGEFKALDENDGIKLVCDDDGEYFYYNAFEALTSPYSNIFIMNRLQMNGKRFATKELFSREGMFPIEIDNPRPEDMVYTYYQNGKSRTEEEYNEARALFDETHTEITFRSGRTKFDSEDPLASLTTAANECTIMKARRLHRPSEEEQTVTSQTPIWTAPTETTLQTEVTEPPSETISQTETQTETAALTEETTEVTTEETTTEAELSDDSGSDEETTTTTTALPVIKRDENNRPYTENTDETRRVL